MTKIFQEKIKKVREEAQTPYKTQIMAYKIKKLLAEPIKVEKTFEEKKKEKKTEKILSEGLEAVASIGESTFAVSTRKRFKDWAEHKGLRHEEFWVDRKSWNKGEPIQKNGKFFIPHEEFKKVGYGAWHISSEIDKLKAEGRDVLVVEGQRNFRFLFKEAKKGELEKKI